MIFMLHLLVRKENVKEENAIPLCPPVGRNSPILSVCLCTFVLIIHISIGLCLFLSLMNSKCIFFVGNGEGWGSSWRLQTHGYSGVPLQQLRAQWSNGMRTA